MSSQYSSHHSSSQPQNQYYCNTSTSSSSSKEVEVQQEHWKTSYEVDDADLVFDGKPLNMLYEENRWANAREASERRGRSRKK